MPQGLYPAGVLRRPGLEKGGGPLVGCAKARCRHAIMLSWRTDRLRTTSHDEIICLLAALKRLDLDAVKLVFYAQLV